MPCLSYQIRLKFQAIFCLFAKPDAVADVFIMIDREQRPLASGQRKDSSLQRPVGPGKKQCLNSESTVRISNVNPRTYVISKVS